MQGYPRLYIGRAAQELKKRVSFPIYTLDKETLQDTLDCYRGVPTRSIPLVFEDLAYLQDDVQSYLLKFIEESNQKIILLSSEDIIIPTILSRMSMIYKIPDKISSAFLPSKEGYLELSDIDSDTYYLTYVKKVQGVSPIVYYYDQLLLGKSNKQKILKLLEY